MLFEGETHEEVFSKAFGKPVGKPTYSKPQSRYGYGKQNEADENPHATPEAIDAARQDAVAQARRLIADADVSPGAREEAYAILYNTNTGRTRVLSAANSGRATNTHFSIPVDPAPGEILVATAHSHPRTASAGNYASQRAARQIDRMNENISRNTDDLDLRAHAPVVLKTPSGRVRVFREPGGYN